jgi:hypothetical protein
MFWVRTMRAKNLTRCLAILAATLAFKYQPSYGKDVAPDTPDTIVVQWNKVALEGVRGSTLGPPMVARALAIIHTCIYDAWAAYDPRAKGTHWRASLRQPKSKRTEENKRIAISYAAYSAAVDLFPQAKQLLFDDFMKSTVGEDWAQLQDHRKTAAHIGILACQTILDAHHDDGANQLGDRSLDRTPYSDYTGYTSLNPRSKIPVETDLVREPSRFQPIQYVDAIMSVHPEQFLGAQWLNVGPFAGPYDNILSRVASQYPVPKFGTVIFETEAIELIELSASLTDEQKMISEYWTDGPNSELPPGHWCIFAQFISARDRNTLDDDVKMFFVLTNAVSDAGIVAWTAKRKFDSVRPITAIPVLYKGKMIRCWGGPGNGTMTMDGSEWVPYQPSYFPTPPFPEYPSGHSAFSAAAARVLELWTNSDRFDYSVNFHPGSSRIEWGHTPREELTLHFPTFSFAADQAGMSRRYGGLHFRTGDLAGRTLGKSVADSVWDKALSYFEAPAIKGRSAAH